MWWLVKEVKLGPNIDTHSLSKKEKKKLLRYMWLIPLTVSRFGITLR